MEQLNKRNFFAQKSEYNLYVILKKNPSKLYFLIVSVHMQKATILDPGMGSKPGDKHRKWKKSFLKSSNEKLK